VSFLEDEDEIMVQKFINLLPDSLIPIYTEKVNFKA
jgi:hypothetical protein